MKRKMCYTKKNNWLKENLVEFPLIHEGEYAEKLSVYIDANGDQAIIPPGWTVSKARKEHTILGHKNNLVIYRIPKQELKDIKWDLKTLDKLQRKYDQFEYTPVDYLNADGTIDGENYTEKFGRRNYRNDDFSEEGYHEEMTNELKLQTESVAKYGGLYASRYKISIDTTGRPRSVKGTTQLTRVTCEDTIKIASTIEDNEIVKSHLLFGAEYDSWVEWRKKSKNYDKKIGICDKLVNFLKRKLFKTEAIPYNNLYGVVGNAFEWTQEKCSYENCRVLRSVYYDGELKSVRYTCFSKRVYPWAEFRAALWIK